MTSQKVKKVNNKISEEEKAALVAWHAVVGVGEGTIAKLVTAFGSGLEAWRGKTTALKSVLAERSYAVFMKNKRVGMERWYEPLLRAGVAVKVREEAGYPRLLEQAMKGTLLLYVRGTLREADERSLAVVGTRKPTAYGSAVTKSLVTALAKQGITIVSGLAYGIDGVAHTAAVNAHGRTIAVLAGDTRRPTPVVHRELAEWVMGTGALVSTSSPYKAVTAGQFVARDRVIAALSLGVLVTEGAGDSGALYTARFGQEMGRPVMAVPGPITSFMSAAPTKLLKAGATLVTEAADVLERIGMGGGDVLGTIAAERAVKKVEDPVGRKIVEILARAGHLDIDRIGKLANASGETVSVALTILELEGLVERVAGEYRLRE